MASATGRGPVTGMVKRFSSCTSARRCSLVTALACCWGSIPRRFSITGTMLWGTRPEKMRSTLRLGASPRSRRMRLSSFCSFSAGFKSMLRR